MLVSDDVVASAVLRCLCDVRAPLIVASSPTPVTLGQSDILGSDEIVKLLGVVGDEGMSAELVLEIVRTLCASFPNAWLPTSSGWCHYQDEH
ncbi:hypothetical protein M404DRAFT_1002963 [Pisolithus tinctorius Marx 270]|uniref:Uncharacterized protein n=1 Tax=Pisolithus tinctorius Marx 270 TaxID=870435 RepID=A0A0C3JVS1_PISTI|nr:hypothetical protein M404DRAFT_1002963 [Pisolithus tinctorius Marx 270]